MTKRISNITLLVHDYDDAIEFYINKLGFNMLSDVVISTEQRWVTISTDKSSSGSSALVVCKANQQQKHLVGKQAGDGVFLFLQTDDFWTDYKQMLEVGVKFLEQPREEDYATVAVFEDLYGNKWDLLQSK